MSLLFSNYVTFTNVSAKELDEIIRHKYSPLYVSVHAADTETRARMLGLSGERGTGNGEQGLNDKTARIADVMRVIDKLHAGGIVLHAQIVLCPDLNDGKVLTDTIEALHGKTRSLAVVPVGTTRYQKNPLVKSVTPKLAREIIETVNERQRRYLKKSGSRFVWCSDEMYQRAGLPIPDFDSYENFPQAGNGVGLLAQFEYDFQAVFHLNAQLEVSGRLKDNTDNCELKTISLATGESAYNLLSALCARAERALPNLKINRYKIVNDFFGHTVTVAGLVTGGDLAAQLKGKDLGELLLLPSVMLRAEGDLFLDGMSIKELSERLNVKIEVIDTDGAAFAEKLTEYAKSKKSKKPKKRKEK
ncbi:hypothetical protein FACS1894211_07810 [Clostridia bacterium]|nr:hypothetical protein FACS1894211_07810 [Clostridia bacterium]